MLIQTRHIPIVLNAEQQHVHCMEIQPVLIPAGLAQFRILYPFAEYTFGCVGQGCSVKQLTKFHL